VTQIKGQSGHLRQSPAKEFYRAGDQENRGVAGTVQFLTNVSGSSAA
jgi:hypothetical protein